MVYPLIAMYMKTSKKGFWHKLSEAAKVLSHLNYTASGVTYTTSFGAGEEGAFFVLAEGENIDNELVVVLPDNYLTNFAAFANDTILEMLTELRDLQIEHGMFAGLDEFTEWFDDKWANYGSHASQLTVTVFGETLQQVPTYSNPNHDFSVWCGWLRTAASTISASSNAATSIYEASENAYVEPLHIDNGDKRTIINIKLSI